MFGYKSSNNSSDSSSSEMSTHDTSPEGENGMDVTDENGVGESRNSDVNDSYADASRRVTESNDNSRLLRIPKSEQEDKDEDQTTSPSSSSEEDDEKKTTTEGKVKRQSVMVGSDYQAVIPDSLCKYGSGLPYKNEDKLLWDPGNMTEEEIENYLLKAQETLFDLSEGVNAIPTGNHMRDDEKALYELMQNGYDVEETLKKRRANITSPVEGMTLWSEEECRNFEMGIRNFEKNFRLIQQNNVRSRTVGELIQFYYLWKKTERHDMWAHKRRLDKKKYSLHPGITDYMDRFLEEQEIGIACTDRSTSPNLQSLVYGSMKGQPFLEPSSTSGSDQTCVDAILKKENTDISLIPGSSTDKDVEKQNSQNEKCLLENSVPEPSDTRLEMTYSSSTFPEPPVTSIPKDEELSQHVESMVQ